VTLRGPRDSARLLIVGPPGVGKGTQAARISESFGIPTISTGDIFRQNIAEGTPLGVEVKKIVDAGDYVPDSLTNELIKDRLEAADAADGFLLDGYPRTPDQVGYLDALLAASGHALDVVVRLVADQDEIVRRLSKRSREQGRTDDSDDAILHRQEVYRRETEPLITMYSERGLLIEVDGLGEVDDITARIFSALADRGLSAAEPGNG
jgi:adenylate kinase